MTSTLTDAIELLCPFLVSISIGTASQLHLTVTVDWEAWSCSQTSQHWMKEESATIMHPGYSLVLMCPAFEALSGIFSKYWILPKWNPHFFPGIYPPWEVTILLSLILTSFCHLSNVKVLACLLPELAQVPHILIMCLSYHKCSILPPSPGDLGYRRSRCQDQINYAKVS